MTPRIFARYSALASLEPLLPRLPVNLLNTSPFPKNAELLFSNTSAYIGSYAALTSEDNILEFCKALLTCSSDSPSVIATSSATTFSKNLECIPVAPTLPISSLSTRMQHPVRVTCGVSRIANKDVNAQTRSS